MEFFKNIMISFTFEHNEDPGLLHYFDILQSQKELNFQLQKLIHKNVSPLSCEPDDVQSFLKLCHCLLFLYLLKLFLEINSLNRITKILYVVLRTTKVHQNIIFPFI